MQLALGSYEYDVSCRAIVLGILGCAPDGIHDDDRARRQAEHLVAAGAAALDLGAGRRLGGPADADAASEQEELDDLVHRVAAIRAEVDVALCVSTERAVVLREACRAGAAVGLDPSGRLGPEYLAAAGDAGASVIVVPGVANRPAVGAGPGAVAHVVRALTTGAQRAVAAGIPRRRILLDAGLDRGLPQEQAVELLRATDRLAALGYPVCVSPNGAPFVGLVADPAEASARHTTAAALTLGIIGGGCVLRTDDVRSARRVADVMAAVTAARSARP